MDTDKDSPKCRDLIESGRKLFWKYGFRRVTVEEICREAHVSKMTFYRCFENKTVLAKTIFSEVIKLTTDKFNEILSSDIPPSEKLQKMLMLKMEGTNDISREFLTDFYNSQDTGLKEYVESVTRTTLDEIVEGFRYAQEKGWIREDFKPEFLLYMFQKLIPMCTDEELLSLYDNPQDMIMEITKFFTYGIAAHE